MCKHDGFVVLSRLNVSNSLISDSIFLKSNTKLFNATQNITQTW